MQCANQLRKVVKNMILCMRKNGSKGHLKTMVAFLKWLCLLFVVASSILQCWAQWYFCHLILYMEGVAGLCTFLQDFFPARISATLTQIAAVFCLKDNILTSIFVATFVSVEFQLPRWRLNEIWSDFLLVFRIFRMIRPRWRFKRCHWTFQWIFKA